MQFLYCNKHKVLGDIENLARCISALERSSILKGAKEKRKLCICADRKRILNAPCGIYTVTVSGLKAILKLGV
jgi:hypothetical protein